MSKMPDDGRDEPVPAAQQRGGVIHPVRSDLSNAWRKPPDPPREPRVENFDVYLKYERWEGYEIICLIIDADPKSIDPRWGPRNRELATAYRAVLEFFERVDKSDLKAQGIDKSGLKILRPRDVIEWINGLRDVLPVQLPDYWPAAQASRDDPIPSPADARSEPSSAPSISPNILRRPRNQLAAEIQQIFFQYGLDATLDDVMTELKARAGQPGSCVIRATSTGVVYRTAGHDDKELDRDNLRKRLQRYQESGRL